MKRAHHRYQRHDLYRKYEGRDSEISAPLGECGLTSIGHLPRRAAQGLSLASKPVMGPAEGSDACFFVPAARQDRSCWPGPAYGNPQ
jgi:hypothetical protein